jgi:phage repressor protein C with HTH and peptisase S24 domain
MSKFSDPPERYLDDKPYKKRLWETIGKHKPNITRKDLSIAFDREMSWFSTFFKKDTPKYLGERERLILAQILGIDELELRPLESELEKTTRYKKVVTEVGVEKNFPIATNGNPMSNVPTNPFRVGLTANLPVWGTKMIDDVVTFTGQKIDTAPRIPSLASCSDAFCVYMTGDVMEPVILEGTLLYCNPLVPVRPADLVVIKTVDNAMIVGRIVNRNPTEIALAQYNPARQIVVARSDCEVIGKIVTSDHP